VPVVSDDITINSVGASFEFFWVRFAKTKRAHKAQLEKE
jgi:hypothetical protein